VLKDIFGFLGVDEGFRPDTRIRHNPTGFIRNPILRALWQRSATPRHWLRPWLPMRARHAAFQWLQRDSYKPPFPADLRAELLEHYRPGIRDLERLLDRDLSLWLE